MSDEQIVDVIADFIAAEVGIPTTPGMREQAGDLLANLRAAGLDVAPVSTIALGRAVEATPKRAATHLDGGRYSQGWNDCLDLLYRRAGVEEPNA